MLWISPLRGWPEASYPPSDLEGIDVFHLCALSPALASHDTWFEKKNVLISLI